MGKTFSKFFSTILLAFLVSCGGASVYSGFQKMDNGAWMKFYERSNETVSPRLKDGIVFEMAQYFNDSMLFSTDETGPIDVVVEPVTFVGDIMDALMNMHVGDSARVVTLADSVFVCVMGMETPEEYAGKPIYYDVKLLSITPFEELEMARRHYLDSLCADEQMLLDAFRNNPKNSVTESGIIIMEKTGKGAVAKYGDYVNFDFAMLTMMGDTLGTSFGIEPMDIQYGEEFVSSGFMEVVGMLPKGGRIDVVLPSSQAFDSVGYMNVVAPYTPIRVVLQMNNIMSKEAHDKYVEEMEAKHRAEHEKAMDKERQLIAKYVKDNAISEQPFESGLYLIVKEDGSGDLANWGDLVSVHYTLYNLNGDEIESSYPDGIPMHFTVGDGEMIFAIEEAVMQMRVGSKVRLITPSELAFGEYEIDPLLLPANTPLVIDLELVSIE